MEHKATPPVAGAGPSEPRLLDQVRIAIRRRHYSYRTEQAYVHWIKRFIHFHGLRHPRDLGESAVTAFLKEVLERPLDWLDGLARVRTSPRLRALNGEVFVRSNARS